MDQKIYSHVKSSIFSSPGWVTLSQTLVRYFLHVLYIDPLSIGYWSWSIKNIHFLLILFFIVFVEKINIFESHMFWFVCNNFWYQKWSDPIDFPIDFFYWFLWCASFDQIWSNLIFLEYIVFPIDFSSQKHCFSYWFLGEFLLLKTGFQNQL